MWKYPSVHFVTKLPTYPCGLPDRKLSFLNHRHYNMTITLPHILPGNIHISTLKTLTDALSQNKSIASLLENEDGSYTIKFSYTYGQHIHSLIQLQPLHYIH